MRLVTALLFLIPSALAMQIPEAGLRIKDGACRIESDRVGKPGALVFREMTFACENLRMQVEVTKPITAEAYARHLANQSVRLTEAYSAGRNPYTGFVSGTTRCPSKQNYLERSLQFDGREIRLHVGRLTERGVWGGCGSVSEDLWGGVATIYRKSALVDIQIKGLKPLARSRFESRMREIIEKLEPM